MNETLQSIHYRATCRAYAPTPLTDAQTQTLAKAAAAAPSSRNRQGWQIIAVRNPALLAELEADAMQLIIANDAATYQRLQERGGTVFYHAPCMFVIAIDAANSPGAELDCGIVAQNITLAAQSMGLGSCVCGLAAIPFAGPRGAYYTEKLGFAQGYKFGIAVLVGEPAACAEPHTPDEAKISYID